MTAVHWMDTVLANWADASTRLADLLSTVRQRPRSAFETGFVAGYMAYSPEGNPHRNPLLLQYLSWISLGAYMQLVIALDHNGISVRDLNLSELDRWRIREAWVALTGTLARIGGTPAVRPIRLMTISRGTSRSASDFQSGIEDFVNRLESEREILLGSWMLVAAAMADRPYDSILDLHWPPETHLT